MEVELEGVGRGGIVDGGLVVFYVMFQWQTQDIRTRSVQVKVRYARAKSTTSYSHGQFSR